MRDIEEHFGAEIEDADRVYWSSRDEAVLARRQRRLGQLVLADSALQNPDKDAVLAAMIEGIRSRPGTLPWTQELRGRRACSTRNAAREPQRTSATPHRSLLEARLALLPDGARGATTARSGLPFAWLLRISSAGSRAAPTH
jgi:hypothetical protein